MVHRVMHPLFNKNKEQLREHNSKVSRETEEQKRKGKRLSRVQYTGRNRRKR